MKSKEKNKGRNPEILKILVLGDTNVGITTFIKRVCSKDFKQPQIPISGVELAVKISKDDASDMYQLWIVKKKSWDKFRSIYFSNNIFDGGLVMFDVTNLESYRTVEYYIQQILMYTKIFIPIALLGNKIDLRKKNSESVNDADVEENCTKLMDKYGIFNCEIKYFSISTQVDQNLDDCFTYLSENYKRYKDVLPKILVLGNKNAGVNDFFKKYIIEDEFYMTDIVVKTFTHQHNTLGMEFILVPQFEYFKEDRTIKNRYYTKAQGLIGVFDVTKRPSFTKIIECVKEFL